MAGPQGVVQHLADWPRRRLSSFHQSSSRCTCPTSPRSQTTLSGSDSSGRRPTRALRFPRPTEYPHLHPSPGTRKISPALVRASRLCGNSVVSTPPSRPGFSSLCWCSWVSSGPPPPPAQSLLLPRSAPQAVPPAAFRRRSHSPVCASPTRSPVQSSGPVTRSHTVLFCPVPSCPDHSHPSHGLTSTPCGRTSTRISRVNSWALFLQSGSGANDVAHVRFCQRILSLRFNGRCPSCFHAMTSFARFPFLGLRGTSGSRVRSSVPAVARDAWSRCLIVALADIVTHGDVRCWIDLLTLLALVLAAPSRSTPLPGVLAWISTESRAMRGSAGDTPRAVSLGIAQRTSCSLHRENARAILRRSPEAVNGSSGLVGHQVDGSGW